MYIDYVHNATIHIYTLGFPQSYTRGSFIGKSRSGTEP